MNKNEFIITVLSYMQDRTQFPFVEAEISNDNEDCSWDKNGNLIFKDKIFEKLTYENTKPYNKEELL